MNMRDAALERLSVASVLNHPWLLSRLGEVNLVGYITPCLKNLKQRKKKPLHLKKTSICVVLLILDDLELIMQSRLPSDL